MSPSVTTAPSFKPSDLAEIKFPECGGEVSFRLLQDAFVPRPVFLVSTQSPVRLECKVESETRLGGDGAGAASIIVALITRAYVTKALYRGRGQIDVPALRLIGRSSVDQYLVADGQFTISRPNTGDAGT